MASAVGIRSKSTPTFAGQPWCIEPASSIRGDALKYNESDLRKDPRVAERGEEVSTAPFEETRETFRTSQGEFAFYQIHNLDRLGVANVDALPWSLKILLESALRQCDGFTITEEHVGLIANWSPETAGKVEVAFMPGRVILQDFTGVASAVDLAALRSAMQRMGGKSSQSKSACASRSGN